MTKLKVSHQLGQGRFASILMGTLVEGNNSTRKVVIKTYSNDNNKAFLNEKSVYEMRHFNNEECLMEFYGIKDQVEIDGVGYDSILVMAYAEHGSLDNYLKNATVTWQEMRKMLLSISRGVANLHADEGKLEKIRPVVCHR